MGGRSTTCILRTNGHNPMMTDQEIRLRILELALEHGISTDKIAVASEFERFVFGLPRPARGGSKCK